MCPNIRCDVFRCKFYGSKQGGPKYMLPDHPQFMVLNSMHYQKPRRTNGQKKQIKHQWAIYDGILQEYLQWLAACISGEVGVN